MSEELPRQPKNDTLARSTKIKRIINLILGVISTLSFVSIIVGGAVATLFADCPSCDARLPLTILILAVFGVVGSIVLIILGFLKDLPYRVDTLFLLPSFICGWVIFQEITGAASSSMHITDKFLHFALYSAGIAFLLEIGLIGWLCVRFFTKNIKKIASSRAPSNNISQQRPSTKKLSISQTITPVLEAILPNNIALVQTALTDHPEELNTAYAQNGNTPLHVAALNGYTEIVRLLLAQPGIDTTRTNNQGKTALDLAREKGFTEIVLLLENK